MYTEKSFEKSFLNIVQLFEIEVVPSIKNKVLHSLHILKGFYTSLPKMIVTFRGSAKSIFPWKCPIQKYRSLFSKKYLLTPCVLRDMLVLDISKVSKSEHNRGRQGDDNVDFRSFQKILHSKLGKLMLSSGFIGLA